MKKLLTLLLTFSLLLSACTPQDTITEVPPPVDTDFPAFDNHPVAPSFEVSFLGLNDPNLHRYIEDDIYANLVIELDSESFFVENVNAIYLSKEYLEQVAFNSQANIYFGFTLSDLDEIFEGTRFIFTLGKDNQTVVQDFERYDDTFDRIIRNVAIGTGVILLCVTVSLVSPLAGAHAVSVIFAASAKGGAIGSLTGGTLSAVVTTVLQP
jgi:hypothetical protein